MAETRARSTAVARKSSLNDPVEVLRRIASLAAKLEAKIDLLGPNVEVRDLTALAREVRELYTICAKTSGLLTEKITVQIAGHPIFTKFVDMIGEAVIQCPKCRKSYEEALTEASNAKQ